MPQIILGPGLEKLDGSLQKLTYSFLTKLASDDTVPGLHIEPIKNSVDPRARTGRVDISYRAVLFKLQGSQHDASYVFAGTYPHDKAIAIAKSSKININPRNGVAELIPVEETAPAAPPVAPAPVAPPVATDGERSLRAREYTVEDLTRPRLRRSVRCGRTGSRRRRRRARVRLLGAGILAGQRAGRSLHRRLVHRYQGEIRTARTCLGGFRR